MAGLVDSYEQKVLDAIFSDPVFTEPAATYLALSSTTPTEAGGNFTEPSGGAYARVQIVAADMAAASGTAPATKANSVAKAFVQASADWVGAANLTHWGIFDALTVGNLVYWAPLSVAKAILLGDTANFPISSLVCKCGDPSDTY